ncbi:4-hydroxy-tetrahydrodipicolinate reductase [Halorubrum halodurans]|uniref:4-hydroxy-tetrahydrodipicolinate reductase n=1 Tax=Halorubrum halodurans TaxID=1383851 RepID=A0A256IR94_9EURY|nr:4-hydroxy-tetrahydrodipicolinate reductase [Halorubrum halodurans]OYR59064.1 4-hydroxy-tetrahydrodipicolinate reductase [Halorubrum halodurans]
MTGDADATRIAVTGAGGRMGREVIEAAAAREDVAVGLAVNRTPTDPVAGVDVADAARLGDLLADAGGDAHADVLVDFTGPESAVEYAETAAEAGVAIVTGTTGFDAGETARLRAASEAVPLLRASNFARGVAALRRAVREAVAAVPGYDVEVTETHHDGKRDAPSGTARTLLDDVAGVREELAGSDALDRRVHGREGDAPRSPGEIGVHARRAGDVTGEHEVLLAGNRETLSLTHRAGDRGVFAEGALDAAAWLAGRDPGWYEFDDVLGEGRDAGAATAEDAAR